MLWKVVKVRALPQHQLAVEFADGLSGVLDYGHTLWGPLFEPLRDPARWAEVRIDEEGVVCWPTGADLAPDRMYERLRSQASAAR